MQQRFPLLTSVFVWKVIAGQADAQSHASVWVVTQEKSERVKVGGHAMMEIDEEGEVVQVVAELISLYEDHQGEAMLRQCVKCTCAIIANRWVQGH